MNKRFFEFLNRLNHTPSKCGTRIDSKIFHKEKINVILTKENGKRKKY